MNQISFTVPGKPRGKGRPRTRTFAKKESENKSRLLSVVYTSREDKDYEKYIASLYTAAGGKSFGEECPLYLDIDVICGIPSGTSRVKRKEMLEGITVPTKKPDTDNIAKSVMDALNGVAYKDDSQIIQLFVHKEYGEDVGLKIVIGQIQESS